MSMTDQAPPDLALIKRDIDSMLQRGDGQGTIDAYLRDVGVTPDQLRADRTPWQKIKGFAGDVGSAVAGAVKGEHDPRYAEVPGGIGDDISDIDILKRLNQAKLVTVEDESYGDIVSKALGPRLLEKFKDKNGYDLITYLGDSGAPVTRYLNKPGLDVKDVDRAATAAMPFVVGGGAAGGLTRVLGAGGRGIVPTAVRTAAQGAGAGSTSLLADKAAQGIGSEQPASFGRAAGAAAGGAVFEALSPAAAMIWRRMVTNPRFVRSGRLTEDGRVEAKAAGLDPDDMDARLAQEFGEDIAKARDPAEVAAKARLGEFDIPSTAGQRTKDPKQLGIEEEMRRGVIGPDAQDIIQGIDKTQTQRIEGAVYDKIGARAAPAAKGREPATTGGSIRDAAREARDVMEDSENALWGDIGPMYPQNKALDLMPDHLIARVEKAGVHPDPDMTPGAHKMIELLDAYWQRKPITSPYAILGEKKVGPWNRPDVDSVRRRLLAMYKNANPGGDTKAAKAVYDSFNDWIDDVAERAWIHGDPATASKLKAARAFTKEFRQLISPTDRRGRATPGGRVLGEIFDSADSPESVIGTLFGRGAPTSTAPRGTFEALQSMKKILAGKDAWDDIKLAYWVKLAQDNKGVVLTPGRLKNNIDGAFQNQKSIIDTLYSKEDQQMMRRLSNALEDVIYKPPNPSGTAYELKRMLTEPSGLGQLGKNILRTKQQRATFSQHNFWLARLYQKFARGFPADPLGTRAAARAGIARRAVTQEVVPRRPPSLGPVGGAAGAEIYEGYGDE